jgi:hypothetical protein
MPETPTTSGAITINVKQLTPYIITFLIAIAGGKGLDQIPGLGPAVEKTTVDAAVAELLDEEITFALTKVDKKMEREVFALREAITDKLGRLQDAVVALKELTLTKMRLSGVEQAELKTQISAIERRLHTVEAIIAEFRALR